MDIQSLMSQVKKQGGQKKSLYNQQAILRGNVAQISKHEQKPNKMCCWFVPKQLQLPFHPTDVADQNFHSENPFIVPGSVSSFIKLIKSEMTRSPELHEMYASIGGFTTDEYDVTGDTVTDKDLVIFNRYVFPYQVAPDCIKITTPDAGKFGRVRLSPIELGQDDNGSLVVLNEGCLAYKYRKLEEAIRDEIVGEFLADKDKSALTSDQKNTLKAKRGSCQVGFPKPVGYTVVLEYIMDEEEETTDKDAAKRELNDCLVYTKLNGDEMKKLMKRKGKRDDIYPDYWELRVVYGDGKPTGDETPEIALYKSREYQVMHKDTRVQDLNPKFTEKITPFLEEMLSGGFEQICKKNIWDFRPLPDKELMELYNVRATEIVKYVTEPIYNEFIKYIEMANLDVAEILHKLKDEKKLAISFTDEDKPVVVVEGIEEDSSNDEEDIEAYLAEDTGSTLAELAGEVVE